VKDHQYHFATKRFPFDGDLLVRNGVVEDFSAVNQDGISMGTVEVESDTPRGAGGLVSGAASKAVVPLVEASR